MMKESNHMANIVDTTISVKELSSGFKDVYSGLIFETDDTTNVTILSLCQLLSKILAPLSASEIEKYIKVDIYGDFINSVK